jgi:hypothetical protein
MTFSSIASYLHICSKRPLSERGTKVRKIRTGHAKHMVNNEYDFVYILII